MALASPEAVFDCLLICRELEPLAGGAGESEIASLGYLGCLLAVYRGMPPADWGYSFAATRSAAPYSYSLADAIEGLKESGHIVASDLGLRLTTDGVTELSALAGLHRFRERQNYVDAACRSASAIPLPLVTESLTSEPQLYQALRLSSSRPLLDEAGRHAVMAHFRALAEALPGITDLFVPAVVWMTYLAKRSEDEEAARATDGAEVGDGDRS